MIIKLPFAWPCPNCGSDDLRGSDIPGGADRVCNTCQCNFDLFKDGQPGCWMIPELKAVLRRK